MRRAIFITILLMCMGVKVHAQIDPTLAGMVLIYTEKTKKTLFRMQLKDLAAALKMTEKISS